ncbi:ATP-binding protein [Streptomyces triticiradicis]|uniref:ATP-binding protein n=1 Tax=Streptomyces triticiradicis TaxID=2651189 RepID=A0A7J5DHQ7_9ACTN|nr:ATP-binding protein [Streptomyces triticiradicis]
MEIRSLTGRRELLDTARAELTARPGVLFHGPPGIGKSLLMASLMTSLAAHAPSAGTVLHCSPVQEDARLPFVGLIDLFSRVPESCLETLAPVPRTALRTALLRGREPADDRSRLAVRVAVLEVLRTLAAAGPVLLVVDGLQWLDARSRRARPSTGPPAALPTATMETIVQPGFGSSSLVSPSRSKARNRCAASPMAWAWTVMWATAWPRS